MTAPPPLTDWDTGERPRLLMVMPYRQLVRKARAEGFWVGAVWDPRLQTPGYLDDVRAAADLFVTVDFADRELLRRTLRDVATEHRASAILHLGREETMVTAHEVAEELRAEVNPTAAIRFLSDKHAMRELLARRELSPVVYESAPSRREVPSAVERVGLPAVVKPVALAGSRGVFLWREPRDLAAWTALVDTYGYEGPFLVEEYLRGPEYSVETLSQDGVHQVVGITEKVLGPPPLFVEVGHVHPAPLPPERAQAVEELAVRFLTVCGYRFGPAHTEVIWTERGPRVVESQARLGGDRIPRLIELAGGLDVERAIFAGLARAPAEVPEPTATAAVRFFTFPPGRVDAIRGLQRLQRQSYVDELTLRLRPGDTVDEVRDSKARQGHVIVSGATPEQARSRLAEALATLEVVVDGTPVRADGRAVKSPAAPGADAQVVFVGYNAAYLRAIDGSVPDGSVVVLEEPDIIRKRDLRDAAARFGCLDRIVPAHYQQSAGALDLAADLEAARPVAAVVPG
ncbi:ATP-grasp domain-containing protein, partial [Streptomyces sp. SID10115]|uniref:ATP-grasp domain-containing protein n=3 Tax=Streptomyces TaxID=1883 RepID=UPI0013C8CF71